MATGSFWDTENPDAPWGKFDTDATITFPIEIDAWLAQLGAGYSSHTIVLPDGSPLEEVDSVHSAGVIAVTMKVADGAEYTIGEKYGFTIRLVCDDGVQQDDRTLFLKLMAR